MYRASNEERGDEILSGRSQWGCLTSGLVIRVRFKFVLKFSKMKRSKKLLDFSASRPPIEIKSALSCVSMSCLTHRVQMQTPRQEWQSQVRDIYFCWKLTSSY